MKMTRSTLLLGRFPQCERTFYTSGQGLPADEVTALAISAGTVWAGTTSGLARRVGERFEFVSGRGASCPPAEAVAMLHADRQGRLWVSAGGELYRLQEGEWSKDSFGQPAEALAEDDDGTLWAASREALYRLDGNGWERVAVFGRASVRSLAAFGSANVYAATDAGLFALAGKRPHWFKMNARDNGLPSDDLRGMAADRWGHLWIASGRGVCIHDDTDQFYTLDGTKGIACEDVRTVALGASDGSRWFGTANGAIRLRDGQTRYFASKRWLPHDEVRAVAIEPDGTVWIGTAGGVSRIAERPMTLEEKADHFDRMVDKYETRYGYVTRRGLTEEGNIDSGSVRISDNDGLWTSDYVAAQCYRYAVTGDERAKEKAKRSMHAVMRLLAVTGRPGFFARSVCHRTEPQFGKSAYNPEWRVSGDGEWEWKGDTSSDELTGHFYAYSIYYDLVADEEDKESMRSCVRSIMDHVIGHDYCLTDVDGLPTTWAVWTPEKLNADAKWSEQRGINSLQMLSFLKTASHITGDGKYEREYRELVTRFHYGMNTLEQKRTFLGEASSIDDNLGFHAYVPLLLYETDPDLRALYMMSLEHHWQFERRERSPLWNAVYGALTGRACDVEAAVRTLAEMPLDFIHWRVVNSGRADVRFHPELAEHGYRLLEEPLPYEERPMHRWDKTPYICDSGDGLLLEDGTVYMHPYWLARYWKLIGEAEQPD